MSEHHHDHDQHQLLQDQRSQCINRRNQLLTELFLVQSSRPDAPLGPQTPPATTDDALLDFLDKNNLDKGRYFSEDSLPPRAHESWTVADLTPPHDSSHDAASSDTLAAPSQAAPPRPNCPDLTVSTNASPIPNPDTEDRNAIDATIPTPKSTIDPDRDAALLQAEQGPTRGRQKDIRRSPARPQSPPESPPLSTEVQSPRVKQPYTEDQAQTKSSVSPTASRHVLPAAASNVEPNSGATTLATDSDVIPTRGPDREGDVEMKDASRVSGQQTSGRIQNVSVSIANDEDAANDELRIRRRKRRKLTHDTYTVVLAKAGPSEKDLDHVRALQRTNLMTSKDAPPSKKKDWMHLLFLRQALDQIAGHKLDLPNLLSSSNKVLTTSDWQEHLQEKQDCNIIKRVYEWQQSSRWTLRQPRMAVDLPKPTSHQDYLMSEMKWLQTDFREERKLKVSVAAELAHACFDFCIATPKEREQLLFRTDSAIINFQLQASADVHGDDANGDDGRSSESLVPIQFPHALEQLAHFPSSFHLDKAIAARLPLFEPWKSKASSVGLVPRPVLPQSKSMDPATVQPLGPRDLSDETERDKPASAPKEGLPPEDDSCALFQPEWDQLRRRQQMPFIFKPPAGPMPSASFYEHRRASQWTEEEDKMLRNYAKDFPSNWNLIADRHNLKSNFTPTFNRRTPWECYERLIMITEGQTADPTTRQYAKQFQGQVDRIRGRWQANMQQQAQNAQSAGQQFGPARFPVPVRVERKSPNKRFLGLVDAARKLARKREAAESSSKRQSSHHESNAHVSKPTSIPGESQTPSALSLLKHKRMLEQNERNERIRQQQRAFIAAQQRGQIPAHANQQIYNQSLSQRLASAGQGSHGNTSSQINGHLAVPGQGQTQSQRNAYQQQQPVPNGTAGSQMQQSMMSGQAQPRNGQTFNGTQMSEQQMQQLMRQQQARSNGNLQAQAQTQAQRQMSGQAQLNRGSPSMANGMSNMNMASQFSQTAPNGDANQSARPDQAGFKGPTQVSPNIQRPVMSAQYSGVQGSDGNQASAQALSSGHMPTISIVQAQISQQHPGISDEELQRMTNDKLQSIVNSQQQQRGANQSASIERSRQAAINAASGLHGNLQQQQQHQQRANSAQSPYGVQDSSYAQSIRQTTSQQMLRTGMQMPMGMNGSDPTRPGSAQRAGPRLASQSPRPLSSQGSGQVPPA